MCEIGFTVINMITSQYKYPWSNFAMYLLNLLRQNYLWCLHGSLGGSTPERSCNEGPPRIIDMQYINVYQYLATDLARALGLSYTL